MYRAGNTASLAAIGAAIDIAPGAERIQLFPIGTWTGRNGLGPYTLADRAHAQQVIDATATAQGPVDLMVDYDHQAVRAPGVAGKAVAAGWIKLTSLEAADDGIWAKPEWTAAASAHLGAREYRYASPYFLHDKQGRITRIINAALTNTPNFNLEAVAASALQGDDMTVLAAIAAALGLPAEATSDQAVAAIEKLKGSSTAAIATSLGLAADADAAAIATGIAALRTKAEAGPDATRFVPIEQLTAVNARISVLEGDRAEAAVASAIQAGKLAPASKAWGLELFRKDEASFASFVSTAPTILAGGQLKQPDIDPKSDVMTDDERAVASSLGLSAEQFLKARKEGI